MLFFLFLCLCLERVGYGKRVSDVFGFKAVVLVLVNLFVCF